LEISTYHGTGDGAPEYVELMWNMLQQDSPDDYVIATGETYSLEEFIATAFKCVGLDWQEHVTIDASLYRPTEIMIGKGNPAKARRQLGWQAKYRMPDVVRMMVEDEKRQYSNLDK
jgi:GDPmannose 4,6-dehydratase